MLKSVITAGQRLLVTTADESTWPTDGTPILFLGEWCLLFNRRSFWQTLDYTVFPYHWDNREKLKSDFIYLSNLHEILLSELAQKLNENHGVAHSKQYWRILIGPWLGYFTQILFDRWSSITSIAQEDKIFGTIDFHKKNDFIPNDMASFMDSYVKDDWNSHIYSQLIRRYTGIDIINGERTSVLTKGEVLTKSGKNRVKETLRDILSTGLRFLQKPTDVFLMRTYLSLGDEIKTYLRLKQSPQLNQAILPKEVNSDMSQRRWVLNGKGPHHFDEVARTFIPLQIPKIYLEGYSTLLDQVKSLKWPSQPKVIWTSNSHHSDDVFKAWTAQKVEENTPLLIGQHGGHYGIGSWSFVEDHELAISDSFLSWGWSQNDKPKVKAIGLLKKKRPLNVDHAKQPNLLLVNNINPRQSYLLFSSTISRQWLDYLDDQFKFVEKLGNGFYSSLIVRTHPVNWGWYAFDRWKNKFPELRIDDGKSDISNILKTSRIYISTYNATTFLESFAMDIPTVIYWNTSHWEIRDEAIPYFEDLKSVGIFHETPESAAEHVKRVWDKVDEWWYGEHLREVLARFKKNFCHVPADLIADLHTTIRDCEGSN